MRRQPRDDRGAAAAPVIRIVVPYAGSRGKTRLGEAREREELSLAMLADVLAARYERWSNVGRVAGAGRGATGFPIRAAGRERRSRRRSARSGPGPVLVVNSDLPSVTADDLRALRDAIPERGIAIAAAEDGTTNALGLSDTTLFAPLYGPRQRRALP